MKWSEQMEWSVPSTSATNNQPNNKYMNSKNYVEPAGLQNLYFDELLEDLNYNILYLNFTKLFRFLESNDTEVCFPFISKRYEEIFKRIALDVNVLKSKGLNNDYRDICDKIIDSVTANKYIFLLACVYESRKEFKNVLVFKKIYFDGEPVSLTSSMSGSQESLNSPSCCSLEDTDEAQTRSPSPDVLTKTFKLQSLEILLGFVKNNSFESWTFRAVSPKQMEFLRNLLDGLLSDAKFNSNFSNKRLYTAVWEALKIYSTKFCLKVAPVKFSDQTNNLVVTKIMKSSEPAHNSDIKEMPPDTKIAPTFPRKQKSKKKANKKIAAVRRIESLPQQYVLDTLERIITFLSDPAEASLIFQPAKVIEQEFLRSIKTISLHPQNYALREEHAHLFNKIRELRTLVKIAVPKSKSCKVNKKTNLKEVKFNKKAHFNWHALKAAKSRSEQGEPPKTQPKLSKKKAAKLKRRMEAKEKETAEKMNICYRPIIFPEPDCTKISDAPGADKANIIERNETPEAKTVSTANLISICFKPASAGSENTNGDADANEKAIVLGKTNEWPEALTAPRMYRAAPGGRPALRRHTALQLQQALAVPVQSDKAMKMMRGMGWSGGALGARGTGITEPIMPSLNRPKGAGLGHWRRKPQTMKDPGCKPETTTHSVADNQLETDVVIEKTKQLLLDNHTFDFLIEKAEKLGKVDKARKIVKANKAKKIEKIVIDEKIKQIDLTENTEIIDIAEKMEIIDKAVKAEKIDKAEKIAQNDRTEKIAQIDLTENMEVIDIAEKIEIIDMDEQMEIIDKAGKAEKIDKAEKIEKIMIAEKIAQIDRAEKIAQIDRAEKIAQIDLTENMEIIDIAEKMEIIDMAEEIEIIDKAGKVKKIDKAEKIEKIVIAEKITPIDSSEKIAQVDWTQNMEIIDVAEKMESINEAGKADKIDKSEKIEKIIIAEKIAQIDRAENVDKPGKAEQIDKAEKIKNMAKNIDNADIIEEAEYKHATFHHDVLTCILDLLSTNANTKIMRYQIPVSKRHRGFLKYAVRALSERYKLSLSEKFEPIMNKILELYRKLPGVVITATLSGNRKKISFTKQSMLAHKQTIKMKKKMQKPKEDNWKKNVMKESAMSEMNDFEPVCRSKKAFAAIKFRVVILLKVLCFVKAELEELEVRFNKELQAKQRSYIQAVIEAVNTRIRFGSTPAESALSLEIKNTIGAQYLGVMFNHEYTSFTLNKYTKEDRSKASFMDTEPLKISTVIDLDTFEPSHSDDTNSDHDSIHDRDDILELNFNHTNKINEIIDISDDASNSDIMDCDMTRDEEAKEIKYNLIRVRNVFELNNSVIIANNNMENDLSKKNNNNNEGTTDKNAQIVYIEKENVMEKKILEACDAKNRIFVFGSSNKTCVGPSKKAQDSNITVERYDINEDVIDLLDDQTMDEDDFDVPLFRTISMKDSCLDLSMGTEKTISASNDDCVPEKSHKETQSDDHVSENSHKETQSDDHISENSHKETQSDDHISENSHKETQSDNHIFENSHKETQSDDHISENSHKETQSDGKEDDVVISDEACDKTAKIDMQSVSNENKDESVSDRGESHILPSDKPKKNSELKTVYLVGNNYPKEMFSKLRAKEIQKLISDNIKVAEELPLFMCHGYQNGALIYSCYNQKSLDWLKDILSGTDVKILDAKTVQRVALKYYCLFEFDAEYVFEMIELYNKELSTKNWVVEMSKVYKDYTIFVVKMDEYSIKYIHSCDLALFAGLDRVEFCLIWE